MTSKSRKSYFCLIHCSLSLWRTALVLVNTFFIESLSTTSHSGVHLHPQSCHLPASLPTHRWPSLCQITSSVYHHLYRTARQGITLFADSVPPICRTDSLQRVLTLCSSCVLKSRSPTAAQVQLTQALARNRRSLLHFHPPFQ